MKIENVELEWFRGTSQEFVLSSELKNLAIYGTNGAGKSTIADAIEYIVNKGKVKHLAHEYSGTRQIKGIRNSHAPEEVISKIKILFDNARWISVEISPDGSRKFSAQSNDFLEEVQNWELQRLILRQEEISEFITDSKTRKYSVLLPLIGLDGIELIAENLKKLNQAISKQSQIEIKLLEKIRYTAEIEKTIDNPTDSTINNLLSDLARDYSVDKKPKNKLITRIRDKINENISSAEPSQKRFIVFQQMVKDDYLENFKKTKEAHSLFLGLSGNLIEQHLGVLEATSIFSSALDTEEEFVICPSCGQELLTSELINHVKIKLEEFNEARKLRNDFELKKKSFVSSIERMKISITDEDISSWLNEEAQTEISELLGLLTNTGIKNGSLVWISDTTEQLVFKIIEFSKALISDAPQTSLKMNKDKEIIDSCESYFKLLEIQEEISQIQTLIENCKNAEKTIRKFIQEKTEDVIKSITGDIQYLWSKMHPNEAIEDVGLYIPKNTDKAIDISLKFYGVDQPSPRITLSEGHRNSLGLSIFLSLVKASGEDSPPILLDDIVSSLDREHRALLIDILKDDFPNQQIILLTHDREWYTELTARLSRSDWKFLILKPWDSPKIGITFSESKYTFDDARNLIYSNPESAGNTARGIMDTQLSIFSEQLKIPVQYLRGDSNDRRGSVEFLNRIISKAKNSYLVEVKDSYEKYLTPLPIWEEIKILLIAWGNPASHGKPLTRTEAEILIDKSEDALDQFKCVLCEEKIWFLVNTGKYSQCECGKYRWKY